MQRLTAVLGSTGLMGSTVVRQRPVAAGFHRPDLEEAAKQPWGWLWVAAAPAEKWIANEDPERDLAGIDRVAEVVARTRAEQVVLISTVDVYPNPVQVVEDDTKRSADHPVPYGRNRLYLEERVREAHPTALVLRLPGVFGSGFKKNLVYDLLHERPEEFTHRDSSFQMYDLGRLCDDAECAVAAGLTTVNLATEPVTAQEIAREVFDRELTNETRVVARYDVRTAYASILGGRCQYLTSRNEVLEALRRFVAEQRL